MKRVIDTYCRDSEVRAGCVEPLIGHMGVEMKRDRINIDIKTLIRGPLAELRPFVFTRLAEPRVQPSDVWIDHQPNQLLEICRGFPLLRGPFTGCS